MTATTFHVTPQARPKALLVGVDFGAPHFDAELNELGLLVNTAGFDVVQRMVCRRQAPDAALFVGSGKAEEIRLAVECYAVDEVFFDQTLSPAQQRNLERFLQCPVNDRTMLILHIFAQRARSHEGKLQVQLAQLQYLSTRLVRRWSHLERQQGGIGTRGGPGERQIELDKRMIADAIKRTKMQLDKVKRQRATQRCRRKRTGTFGVALVGYTNAGKTTLFNALVKAGAYAANKLFATLDTTTRQMYLQSIDCAVSVSDTVGFIRDLPHGLVDAFEATLQEATDADLLLHVVDGTASDWTEQLEQVQYVLAEIDAQDIPQILVFNKSDALPHMPHTEADSYEYQGKQLPRMYISAKTGMGLDMLRHAIAEAVTKNMAGHIK